MDRRKPRDRENPREEKETSANALECVACRCKTHFTGVPGERCAIESIAFVSVGAQACHRAVYFSRCCFLFRINVCQNLAHVTRQRLTPSIKYGLFPKSLWSESLYPVTSSTPRLKYIMERECAIPFSRTRFFSRR